jgi:Na+/melibiose symporter-like transporter
LVPGNWYGTPSLVQQNQWLIFIWYAGTLCLYDSTLTIYEVNVISLYPDKFRALDERRTTQLFGTILGITGLVLAAIIPPMIIGEALAPSGYINASIVIVGIGFILFLLILPGVYEGKKTKRLYQRREESGQTREVEPFIKSTAKVVNDKTFMLKILHFFGYQVGGVMIQTSALYITTYILGMGAEGTTLLLGSMLIGALISVPIWGIIGNKINNNRKIGIIGGFTLFLGFIPLIFVTSLAGWMISLVFFGVGIGANWYIDPPLMGDVLDDISVRTGKSQHAIYYGIQSFFIKFGQTFIAVTIALSHIFTGYVQGAETQTPLAIFGIRIHTAIVPAILMLITITVFYKYYKLTPDKVAINQKKLKEMGI